MTYNEAVTEAKNKLETRIVALMNRIRNVCKEDGLVCSEVFDNHCDDYRWSFTAKKYRSQKRDLLVDITLQIAESQEFEGTEDGINFMLDIVGYGGRILGGMAPYNYTPEVWVKADDMDAVEARFKLLEDADIDEVPYLIRKAWDKTQA